MSCASTLFNLDKLTQSFQAIDKVEILDWALNVGDRRAIALGLAHAARGQTDCIVVMDSDGEDRPDHVAEWLGHFRDDRTHIHVVEQGKRSESFRFKEY